MVSRVTAAAAQAAGLSRQMKALAFGTISGERSILHVDPNSVDLNAAFPRVTEEDGKRLEKAGLAEDYEGDLPSDDELLEHAQKHVDQQHKQAVTRAEKLGLTPPIEPFRLQAMRREGLDVDANAARKVARVQDANNSTDAATGLDSRETTHHQTDPAFDRTRGAGEQADEGTGEGGEVADLSETDPDAAPGSDKPATGKAKTAAAADKK